MKPRICPKCYFTYFYAEDYDLTLHCARCKYVVGSIDEGWENDET